MPSGGLRVALLQGGVRLQAALCGVPVQPVVRLQGDEIEPLHHAPCYFFVQPGALCVAALLPAGGGLGVDVVFWVGCARGWRGCHGCGV